MTSLLSLRTPPMILLVHEPLGITEDNPWIIQGQRGLSVTICILFTYQSVTGQWWECSQLTIYDWIYLESTDSIHMVLDSSSIVWILLKYCAQTAHVKQQPYPLPVPKSAKNCSINKKCMFHWRRKLTNLSGIYHFYPWSPFPLCRYAIRTIQEV